MTRLICLLCLLVAMTLACGVSAPSQAQPTPLTSATPEKTITPPILPLEKPSKMQSGYNSVVTAEKWLYVRSSASHYAEVVGYLVHGEQITVLECAGVWGRIGIDRWINTIYLETGCE